jgi:hypothetical protein
VGTYIVTIGLIFAITLAGIGVDRLYRNFAKHNPQLGPFRKQDGCGCCSAGSGCSGESGGSCER